MIGRRKLIAIVLTSFLLFLSVPTFAYSNSPKNEITISNLISQVTETASSIVTYKASFIYTKLENGLKEIKELKNTVNEKLSSETSISTLDIIKKAKNVFETLYKEYKEIDENKDAIEKGFDARILQSAEEVKKSEEEIELLENQLVSLKEKLKNSSDQEERKSLEAQVNLLEIRIKIWKEFENTISTLPSKSKNLEKKVNHFLKIVHLSVPVYHQAYMALSEMEQIREFLADINALSNLDLLSSQIEESWVDITNIVKSIEDISRMSEQKGYSILQIENMKIQRDSFFENVFEGISNLFKRMWNFLFHPKIYTWEDVAKIVKEMSDNMKIVIAEL